MRPGIWARLTRLPPNPHAEKCGLGLAFHKRQQHKVIVGGAPVTPAFAKQIGADAYAPDAATAVDVARGLAA